MALALSLCFEFSFPLMTAKLFNFPSHVRRCAFVPKFYQYSIILHYFKPPSSKTHGDEEDKNENDDDDDVLIVTATFLLRRVKGRKDLLAPSHTAQPLWTWRNFFPGHFEIAFTHFPPFRQSVIRPSSRWEARRHYLRKELVQLGAELYNLDRLCRRCGE